MKIAYLILAHKNPNHLKKMIEALSCEDSSFFIHVDKKSNIDDFSIIQGGNISFIDKRMPVYWAEYSMVEALLILIQKALDQEQVYDYCVRLSCSDYPLRSKKYIHDFFEKNRGTEFISMIKVPNDRAGVPLSRINTLRIPSTRPVYRFTVRVLAKLGFAQRDYRKHLVSLEPYAGCAAWALTRDACQYILNFVKTNQTVCNYYAETFASDEGIFHTILGNSTFRRRIRKGLMYTAWPDHGGHPAMINEKHVEYFEARDEVTNDEDLWGPGELLFARKFSDDNPEIVQRIDDMIRRKDKG